MLIFLQRNSWQREPSTKIVPIFFWLKPYFFFFFENMTLIWKCNYLSNVKRRQLNFIRFNKNKLQKVTFTLIFKQIIYIDCFDHNIFGKYLTDN